MSDILTYDDFPNALAPRRFALINPERDNGVYGHGVVFSNGYVLVATPLSQRLSFFPAVEEVERVYVIRWLDPPFPAESEDTSHG